jgi:hypothetical protein
VLDPRFLGGHSPTNEEYHISGYEPAFERISLMVPRTIVSNVFRAQGRGNSCVTLLLEPRNRFLRFLIRDLMVAAMKPEDRLMAHLTAYFDYTLRPVTFSGGDDFDALYAALLREGRIPGKTRHEYLREYKNCVLYWDGTQWQPKPVMNRRYLSIRSQHCISLSE